MKMSEILENLARKGSEMSLANQFESGRRLMLICEQIEEWISKYGDE